MHKSLPALLLVTTLALGSAPVIAEPPTISPVANQTLPEDTPSAAIEFTVGDAETPVESLTVTVASTNAALIPLTNVTLGGTGALRTVTILPATNLFGESDITLTVTDGDTETSSTTFHVTVTSSNELPVIAPIADMVMNEDGNVTIPIPISDVETATSSLSLTGTRTNTALFASIGTSTTSRLRLLGGGTASRSLQIRPSTNQFGMSEVTLTVTDANSGSSSRKFLITVNPVWDPPIAVNDSFYAAPDTNTTFSPLTNDVVGSEVGQEFWLAGFTQPTNGTLALGTTTNTVVYTPDPGYTGPDSFVYTNIDNAGVQVFATATIAVSHPPTISAISDVVMDEDGDVTINFTVGDVETAAASLTVTGTRTNTVLFSSIGTSASSRLQIGGSGTDRTLRIRPDANRIGQSLVTLTVRDASGGTASSSFLTTVNNTDDPAVAHGDTVFAFVARPTSLNVAGNDVSVDGTPFTVTSATPGAHGTTSLGDNNTVIYTATNGFRGFDEFTYTITDVLGSNSTATVEVWVGVIDIVHTDLYNNYLNGEWYSNIKSDLVPQIKVDSDEAVLFANSSTRMTLPALGPEYAFIGAGEGEEIWMLPELQSPGTLWLGFSNEGTDIPGVQVGTTRIELVSFFGPGHFAMFQSGSFGQPIVAMDSLDGVNSTNDAALGGNSADSYELISHSHMNWSFTLPGRYTFAFRPSAMINTTNSEGQPALVRIAGSVATYTIDVDALQSAPLVENPPLVRNDVFSVAEDSAPTTINVLANDSSSPDPGEALTITAVTQPAGGSVAIAGDAKSVTYTPSTNFFDTNQFTYTVTDEHGGVAVAEVVVTVNAVNDAPTISAISGPGVDGSGNLIMNEDGDITVNFTVDDAETDGGSLTVAGTRSNTTLFTSIGTTSSSRLQLAVVSGGLRSLRARPAANLSGNSSVTLSVTDGTLTNSRTFNIVVNPVNDMPSFTKGANLEHINNNTGLKSFPAWATAINDGDAAVTQVVTFQVNVVSGASIFAVPPVVSANGTLSYTLSGTPGVATMEVRLTDDATAGGAALTSAAQTFTIASFSFGERQVIAGVHADAISVFADDGVLTLESMADIDGEFDVRLNPDEVIFNVEEATRTVIPTDPQFAFLGTVGSDVWIAPEQNPGGAMLWPGFNTENVPVSLLDGDQVTLRLESVSGPGTLHVFTSDSFGEPIRHFSSTDTNYRSWTLPQGTHVHANWAFSATGTYVLTFSANATTNGTTVTAVQSYTFVVGNMPTGAVTTTTLVAAPLTNVIGSPVTLTATVNPSNAVGYLEFLNGTTVLTQKIVSASAATFTTTNLNIGMHALTARFVPGWTHDFAASTSAPVNVTITEPGGVPFTVTGVAASYQPGQALNAQVVGYTLQAGQQFRWYYRPPEYTGALGSILQTSTSYNYSKALSASDAGYQISAVVRQGSVNIAQTPWVTVNVPQAGTRPVLTRTDTNALVFPGTDIELVASELNLGPGETWQLVRRFYEFHDQWAPSPAQFPEPNRAVVSNDGSPADYYYAARVMSNGIAVRQSDLVLVQMLPLDVDILGLLPLYRSNATMNATVSIYPPLPANAGWEFTWYNLSTFTVMEIDTDPQNIAITIPGLTVAAWNGTPLAIRITKNGNLVAIAQVTIYVTDSQEQFVSLLALSGHYHQGETINLRLLADPPLDAGDQIAWSGSGQGWIGRLCPEPAALLIS